jgi:hypothetical protein
LPFRRTFPASIRTKAIEFASSKSGASTSRALEKISGTPPSVRVFGQGNSERAYRTHLKFSEPAKLVAYLINDHAAPLSVDVPENVYQKGTSSREHGRARLPQKQAAVNPTKLCQNPFK